MKSLTSDKGRDENLGKAWERYRNLTTDCPHHGFRKSIILGTFYRGCNPDYRRLIDSSSKGSFSCLNVHEGEKLINTMAKNDRDNQDWSRRPTTPCGMMSLQDITNALRQDDADQRDAYFCGTGNPHNDGSGQILRDMEWEENLKSTRKRHRETPLEQAILNIGHNVKDRRKKSGEYDYQDDFDEIKGMILGIMKMNEAEAIFMDAKIDRMEQRALDGIKSLHRKYDDLEVHMDSVEEKVNKEYILATKEEEDALAFEYCQFVEAERLRSLNARLAIPSGEVLKEKDRGPPVKLVQNVRSPILKDTGTGIKLLSKPSPINPPVTSNVPPKSDIKKMVDNACAMMIDTVRAIENSGRKFFEPGDDDELRDQYEILMLAKARIEERSFRKKEMIPQEIPAPVKEPTVEKAARARVFPIPCSINRAPPLICLMDSNACECIMPYKVARSLGINNLEGITPKIILVNDVQRRIEKIAKDVLVSFEGLGYLVTFVITDSTRDGINDIVLGKPFLEASLILNSDGCGNGGSPTRKKRKEVINPPRSPNQTPVKEGIEYVFFQGSIEKNFEIFGKKSKSTQKSKSTVRSKSTRKSKSKSTVDGSMTGRKKMFENFKEDARQKTWRQKRKSDPGDRFSLKTVTPRGPPAKIIS